MPKLDLGHGFFAVPYDAVTLNRLYLPQLDTAPPDHPGPFALLMPNNRAAENEDDTRAYRYATLDQCREDVETLRKYRFKPCNRCGTSHDTTRDLCPTCHNEYQARIDSAANGLARRGMGHGTLLAATFEQDAINHEFKIGPYAPTSQVPS